VTLGGVRLLTDDANLAGREREPLDRDLWPRLGQGREVEGVLRLDVDGAFVSVDVGDLLQGQDGELRVEHGHAAKVLVARGPFKPAE